MSGLDPARARAPVRLVRRAPAAAGRIARHFKRRDSIWGVCWFDPQAREAISRARYCAWLLEEGGLPVRTITSAGSREVIWRDAHQIVTKPEVDLPRAFA